MEIRLEDFTVPTIEKKEDFDPEIVDNWLSDYEGFRNAGQLHSVSHFTKQNTQILMRATMNGNIIGVCSRCLEDAIIPINVDITIMFIPSNKQRKYIEDEEVELQSEELDIEYYRGNKINVDYIFRESLILEIPYSPLCNDSCQGLCPVCGGNLNRNECKCKERKLVFNNIKLNLF